MKIFKTILCIIFSIEVLLAITLFLVNPDVMYVVIGIIFAFLAFWSFKSSRKHKKKGHQNNNESLNLDSAIKDLSTEIAGKIQFATPELTEQQQRDYEAVKEAERMSSNPKFHRTFEEEELSFDFEEKWGSQIHFLESEMQKKYSAAAQAQDYDTAIDLAKEALTLYQTLKTFCYQKGKGGEIYFQDIWEYMHNSDSEVFSYKDTIDRRIAYWEEMRTLKEETLSLIASKRGELLQKDIYSLLPSHSKNNIQKIIRELESDGLIHREKKGSTYLLIAK
ncbi:hypothetical protein V1225_05755 [Emergencia sp. JLR.KK010]|uniref:helix-turn-helix transcriptional regulator n=1 Tax=Emergencia sp. JLR.KK010 TaxID=3114296 RepID=UPI0030CF631D